MLNALLMCHQSSLIQLTHTEKLSLFNGEAVHVWVCIKAYVANMDSFTVYVFHYAVKDTPDSAHVLSRGYLL